MKWLNLAAKGRFCAWWNRKRDKVKISEMLTCNRCNMKGSMNIEAKKLLSSQLSPLHPLLGIQQSNHEYVGNGNL